MSAPTTTAPEAIQQIERLYEFREPEAVRAFLAKNPDLIDLLVEAAVKIPEFLPPDGRIVLEVVWDPEDEDEEDDELFALVPTRMPWEEVLPRYRRLVREWLVPTARFAIGRFNVGPECH
jgi:hypothetical protein